MPLPDKDVESWVISTKCLIEARMPKERAACAGEGGGWHEVSNRRETSIGHIIESWNTTVSIIDTLSIDGILKSWRYLTALYLFLGKCLLCASADDTVSSKVATHSSSSFTIRAGNQSVSTSFLSILLMGLMHFFSPLQFNQPSLPLCRSSKYLLHQHNEPAIFVMGERQGQCVPPSGLVGGMPLNLGAGPVGMGIGVGGWPNV